MTAFALKLIAVICMFTDHLAYTLSLADSYFAEYMTMRAVGRVAFPVFAFLLVNGFEHTRSPLRYLGRLAVFAAVSQPFYALAFSRASYRAAPFADFQLFSPDLNVFFTLALSLGALWAIAALVGAVRRREGIVRALGALLCAALIAAALIEHCDYGYMGLALVLALYAARRSRVAQACVIALWSVILYAFPLSSWTFVAGAASAGILVLLYNGKRGARARWVYFFYPLHLAALWAVIRLV